MKQYRGTCVCKAIEFQLKGEPIFTQHCHCNKCREIAALSKRATDKIGYSYTAAYPTAMLTITRGADKLETLTRYTSDLFLCKHCQSYIYGISQDPAKQAGIGVNINNIDFADGVIPATFKPDKHIWYQDKIVELNDDLPKYKDAPVEQYGTGELMSN